MEILSKVSVGIFDNTGTLTEGNPQVTDIIQLNETAAIITGIGSSNGYQLNALDENNQGKSAQRDNLGLSIAAIAEKGSEQPLAKAIVNYASVRQFRLAMVKYLYSIDGLRVGLFQI